MFVYFRMVGLFALICCYAPQANWLMEKHSWSRIAVVEAEIEHVG